MFNKGTNPISNADKPSRGKLCKIVTNMLSITIDTIIIEYILFSSKLMLFFEKYIIHSNAEKKIEHAGKRIPDILSPLLLYHVEKNM